MASEKRGKGHLEDPDREDPGLVPEILRRVLALGFSGFFMTEGALRKALGETLPKDWIDFAVDQSERTRDEFLERLAGEIARSVETIDLVSLAERLLEGHTVEVKAEIRLRSDRTQSTSRPFHYKATRGRRS